MHLDALLWLFLPVFVAGGSALLSFYIMQAKMEVAVSKERESLAEARATISSQKVTMEERIRATEESVKRAALDDFLKDFRVEERSYVRETRSLASAKRSMVMQERLFFRNIPLSNWVEHEMVVEEGSNLKRLQEEASIFSASSLPAGSHAGSHPSDGRLPISKLLDDATPVRPQAPRSNPLIAAHAAFGAQ